MADNDVIHRGEFETYMRSQDQLRDVISKMITHGFENVSKEIRGVDHRLGETNERISGINDHLVQLNGKTAVNMQDIERMKGGVGDTQQTAHLIERELPSHLLKKKQTYIIAGAGTGMVYGLVEFLKQLAEIVKTVLVQ